MSEQTQTAIHTRAVLVWLTIGTWSARKYDRTATAKVIRDYQASNDAARVNKALLPADAAGYKALTQLATAIRATHYAKTLAWSDEGWRLLPTAAYADYTAWFRQVSTEFENARQTFGLEYPGLKANAPARLNGLYRASDYPDTSEVIGRFKLDVQFNPVPAVGDFRVDLGSDQIAAIEANVSTRLEAATRIAVNDAWTRLHDCVAHIAERLSDPTAIFRDSLIENAKDVCDALKRLNVTDDPNLESMRQRVESELTKYSPDILRDAPTVRADTAQHASDIMAAMSELYGPIGA